jgi:hypothetical protein
LSLTRQRRSDHLISSPVVDTAGHKVRLDVEHAAGAEKGVDSALARLRRNRITPDPGLD